jgi:DNA polymerase IV
MVSPWSLTVRTSARSPVASSTLARTASSAMFMGFSDLNSCFATIEQQANPLLRGKLIMVAAYNSPNGCVVAPSIEAKHYGIKTGMTVRDAKLLYPAVIVRTPDPAKYRAVHVQFRNIFKDYSPDVSPKSIDEAVIDFTDTYALHNRTLPDIGREIKRRFREEIGEWMQCSIGIGTNRFLAKLAASLQKPDGLTTIDHTNVLSVYERVRLLDLNGINTKNEARLNTAGIFTPLEFLNASVDTLKKLVFQSITGYYWYLRLRGYEIDDVEFGRKSFGNTYALGKQTNDPKELAKLLMKLCEKTAGG